MTKWLEKMRGTLAVLPAPYNTGVGKEPPTPVGEGETIVGDVPDALRPMWGLVLFLYDEAQARLSAHDAAHANGDYDDGDCTRVIAEAEEMIAEAAAMKEVFFISVRHELGTGRQPLGVRGLQVITRPERRPRPQVEIVMVGLPPGLPSIFGEPVAEA